MIRGAAVVVAVVAVAIGLGLFGARDDRLAVALVSGRDDHGVEVTPDVTVHDRPGGAVTDRIPADTLVAVHDQQPPWLLVSTLEGPDVSGWVDDFVLRGELHVVSPATPACATRTPNGVLEPSARVRVVDVHDSATGVEVGVVPVTGGREFHVPRAWVRELPGPRRLPGQDCAALSDGEPIHQH